MERNPDIVSIYSEFIFGFRESGDRLVPCWGVDPKLKRHMQRLFELDRDPTEELWARYFLRVWREEVETGSCDLQAYTERHLSAYFQRTCLHVAYQLNKRFSKLQFLNQQYTVQDYFQTANLFASNPGELLRNFSLKVPSSVQAYARKRLEGLVAEKIRKENPPIDWLRYSPWGLLRSTCPTELRAALKGRMNLDKVEQHVLAWQCFKEIYAPTNSSGSRRLPPPTDEELQQIAKRYNQQRLKLSKSGKLMNEDRVIQILEDCIQTVRDWRTVSFSYPDANRDAFDPSSGDWWELISPDNPNDPANEPMTRLGQEEKWQQIDAILSEAFEQLPTDKQNLLKLYFGLEATQVEIARTLNLKQYQISRKVKDCKRLLLMSLARWCEVSLNLSNDKIAQLDVSIKEWLEKYCKQRIF